MINSFPKLLNAAVITLKLLSVSLIIGLFIGLLFAILCGIGTAVLGWYDSADWMNIVAYSLAVTGLILWGWYHFSVRWINEALKQNIFTKFDTSSRR